jgi:midasin (ATPase involved in ribosome maturation)
VGNALRSLFSKASAQVFDELNLAPSEVLEALNRLLDDNRELYIPETQEVVKPHPRFMLFATQNPPWAVRWTESFVACVS